MADGPPPCQDLDTMATQEMDTSGDQNQTILVVDDDRDIRVALEMLLQYEGFTVWTARDGNQALLRLEKERESGRAPVLILTDVKMPGLDGMGLLAELQKRAIGLPVVMISGHADVAMAVDAVKHGAVDILEKPLDQNRVLISIRSALRQDRLKLENRGLRKQLSEQYVLCGESPAILNLRRQIERVAPSDAPVLITGENGTGKEIVARNLHLASPRVAGEFIAVNCAAIPSELIESELFGHERGSFTGAQERRIGHFEAASGGTLFLDEIGDMPLAAQAKVLRALETHEITRVGSAAPIRIDLRVVAATNADLQQAVEAKTFRMDLFFRLNVIPLRLPALREHREDVPILVEHFCSKISEREGKPQSPIDDDALELLKNLDYPGNVRELRNLLEGAHIFGEGPAISRVALQQVLSGAPTAFGESNQADPFQAESFEDFKNQSEALFFRRKLDQNDGNVKRTAEQLGMQRSHLYKKLDRYDLRR